MPLEWLGSRVENTRFGNLSFQFHRNLDTRRIQVSQGDISTGRAIIWYTWSDTFLTYAGANDDVQIRINRFNNSRN